MLGIDIERIAADPTVSGHLSRHVDGESGGCPFRHAKQTLSRSLALGRRRPDQDRLRRRIATVRHRRGDAARSSTHLGDVAPCAHQGSDAGHARRRLVEPAHGRALPASCAERCRARCASDLGRLSPRRATQSQERCGMRVTAVALDMVGVTGSIPVAPTTLFPSASQARMSADRRSTSINGTVFPGVGASS